MSIIKNYISGLVGLLFPQLCLACNNRTPVHGANYCISCLSSLPYTLHFTQERNDFRYHFYGRVDINFGAALLVFNKGSVSEDMLHRLKYKRHKKVGEDLGTQLGIEILNCNFYQEIDLVVPVPIHPHKKITRGYNQSELVATEVARILGVSIYPDLLKKKSQTKSLTKLGRTERVDMLLESLDVDNSVDITGKHILLIDDVLTTGATLEACAMKIAEFAEVKISMATLAITKS